MATPHTPTLGARRAIRKLGSDLRRARLRRHLPMEVVAERAFISRGTLARVEHGDPAVSFGIYASVLQALGLIGPLADLAADDPVGADLADEQLPKRVRAKRVAEAPGR
ncbi:helix-turn-helix domain-containing protein [Siccirubricoccus sp. KC 17139]|uniref:Helix-turn-helix domain-containing protein n=1 Tax=Siccirubricoccus soli TaxID=2899147 RepID=A0ABT1D2N9_9PROT|nr:helix-turn-helix domain-containing protein [Siccirubricoccus soli]MCO6416181.1 helix-turn-helix domain-containing protein [Siccirubricoccus soli]MCP2682315.1 helix-turn-helix domain-containing protein [Siccirubricoccus soli]